MNTYVVSIGGQAVLAFRAEDDNQAREMIDDHEGNLRSDLQTLVDTDGKPLWDGKTAIHVKGGELQHNMPNGSSRATKQSAMGKSTWMPATIRTSGTSI